MCDKLIFFLCTAILYCCGPSVGSVDRQADDCSSSFISMDRIEAAVRGEPTSADHKLGDVLPTIPSISRQAILPYINFTCDGSILSWTFGAQWEGNSPRHTELQIWRSSGDGSYIKVGSTTIMLEEENSTRLYQYTLTSPLPFQAGDILGYFQSAQSTSQLRLLFEDVGSDHPLYFNTQDSPSSQFITGSNSVMLDRYHLLISVSTDSAGCDCGFMSVGRIRILLGLETVGDRIFSPHRQQITPDIKFTCDGLITKWILGADWHNDGTLYPELQVWRKSRNDIYHKKNGTVIKVLSQSPTRIYKYDAFSPIPFLAGDILGIFLPQMANSKLRLWSERANGPIVYHVDTGASVESPVDAIDLKHMSLLSTTSYLPLVTVKIVVSSPTRSGSSLPTLIPTESVATPPGAASTNQTVGTDGDTIYNESLIVGMGVAGSLLVLITATVIVIVTVLVCLRKNNKVNFTANVAYQSSTSEVKLSPNAAYTVTGDHSPNSDELDYYLYIEGATADVNANGLQTAPNPAYKITTSTNKAYVYEVTSSSTPASLTSGVPMSTNQAYEAAQHQSGKDALNYENSDTYYYY